MAIFSSARLNERRFGQKKLEELKSSKSKTILIHYSCESFYNTHGRTPRVTSIAVKNRDNNSSEVFSIHLMAQIQGKDISNLSDEDFDFVEKEMLKDFYKFMRKHASHRWVHWNMRNASYGFEAIANRYRILGGTPKQIEDQFKYNLPEILSLIHTYHFESHDKPVKGQFLNLAVRNNIATRDALVGDKEAKAFDDRDFLKLHMSSMRKVEILDRILTALENNQLKVATPLYKACGLTPSGIVEMIRNNWLLFLLWSILMAILGMAIEPVVQNIFGTAQYGQ